MVEDVINFLESSLVDSDNLVIPKRDYRKLVAIYHCTSPKDFTYLCSRYSPSQSGCCSFQLKTENATLCLAANGDGS